MFKTTIKVSGMACSMCEDAIAKSISKAFKVKKAEADRSKGEAIIISPAELDINKLKKVIYDTGYTPGEAQWEPYEKKGLFGR